MDRGHAYLVAVMDWHARAVLSWRLSNTLDTRFCLEAFDEAVKVAGRVPEIFNTDQGCQFTSRAWREHVGAQGVRLSMDGKGRWLDNVFSSDCGRRSNTMNCIRGNTATCGNSGAFWSNGSRSTTSGGPMIRWAASGRGRRIVRERGGARHERRSKI
jgi:hypothetical protein